MKRSEIIENATAQLTALTNAAHTVPGLTVHPVFQEDKRKTVPLFTVNYCGSSVCGRLNYDQANHFLIGFIKAAKLKAVSKT